MAHSTACTKPTHWKFAVDVIYFLIPLALILLITAVAAFLWAVRSGQFDDLDREAHRILFDEDLLDTKSDNRSSSSDQDNHKAP